MSQTLENPCSKVVKPMSLATLEDRVGILRNQYRMMLDALDLTRRAPFSQSAGLEEYLDLRDEVAASLADFGEAMFEALCATDGATVAQALLVWDQEAASAFSFTKLDGKPDEKLATSLRAQSSQPSDDTLPASPSVAAEAPEATVVEIEEIVSPSKEPHAEDTKSATSASPEATDSATVSDTTPDKENNLVLEEPAHTEAAEPVPRRPAIHTIQRDETSLRSSVTLAQLAPTRAATAEVKVVGKVTLPKQKPAKITPDRLALLKDAIQAKGMDETDYENMGEHMWGESISRAQTRMVRQWLNDAMPLPKSLGPRQDLRTYVGSLRGMLKTRTMREWSDLPRELACAMLSYSVAYQRKLLLFAEERNDEEAREELHDLFQVLSWFSTQFRPGHVHGMALNANSDVGDSWFLAAQERLEHLRNTLDKLEDKRVTRQREQEEQQKKHERKYADSIRQLRDLIPVASDEEPSPDNNVDEAHVTQLLRRLSDNAYPSAPRGALPAILRAFHEMILRTPSLSALHEETRAELSKEEKRLQREKEQTADATSPWAFPEITQGKSMAIIGGSPRTDAVERIKEHFGLEQVYWMPTEENGGPRQNRRIRNFVQRGTYDYVVALRNLIRHAVTDELFGKRKPHPNCTTMIAEGYGTVALEHAFQRFLKLPDPSTNIEGPEEDAAQ